MEYNITVSEDRTGNISVTNVDKIVKLNQYRASSHKLPSSTFSVARLTSNPKVRASRKTNQSAKPRAKKV